jgi:hypothetical protein
MQIRIEKSDYIIKPSGISLLLEDPALMASPTTVPIDPSLKPHVGKEKTVKEPQSDIRP